MESTRWGAGLLVALAAIALVAGCNQNAGHANPEAAATEIVESLGPSDASEAGTVGFVERLRSAATEMAALEAEVRSMGEGATVELLVPLLADDDPVVAERAADLLLAFDLEWKREIVVLYALRQLGDARAVRYRAGERRLLAMGRKAVRALVDIYREGSVPDAPLAPDLAGVCERLADVLLEWRDPDVRKVLVRCLRVPDMKTAWKIGWYLAIWDGPGGCRRLAEMLRSVDPIERVGAMGGVIACGDRGAVDDLLPLLSDSTPMDGFSPAIFGISGPRDQPKGEPPEPSEPATIGRYAEQAIDSLTGRRFLGDTAAIEEWVRTHLPPADGPNWVPPPLAPAAFWRDPQTIDPLDARRGEGDGCRSEDAFTVDLRGDNETTYRVRQLVCRESPAFADPGYGTPEFVTFSLPEAADAELAFTDLASFHGAPDEIDPDAGFAPLEEVHLRQGPTRQTQILVARVYGGNGRFRDWCVVGPIGDSISCWSQPDLDARAKALLAPDELIGLSDWSLDEAGDRLRLVMWIWDQDDAHCCPSRGRFVAELTAHPTESRLVEASFVRERCEGTNGESCTPEEAR
jgi:hypothetical protein